MSLANDGQAETRRQFRPGRAVKLALVSAYLGGLATVPHLMTLGFGSGPAVAEPAQLAAEEAGRFQPVSWEQLGGFAYDFGLAGMLADTSEEALARRHREILPQRVRSLDGSWIALRGYVIPTEIRGDLVRSFILAAKNEVGCCFGDGLAMNQWVAVEVPEERQFRCEPFALATVLGTLDVGEEVEDGYVMSLYRMAAQEIREE